MSFFNSLQQYVTTGVAQLGLSPRRSSRPDAQEPQEPTPATVLAPHPTTAHGFPKVVPTLGTTVPPVRRQSSMSVCLIPPRQSSFRQRTSPVHPHAPALVFCKRRMSWPEIDNTSTSGVHESDGSYFESFTALSWKRENRRIMAVRTAETRAETVPIAEISDSAKDTVKTEVESPHRKEQMYMDVLTTIGNSLGCDSGQVKEEMYLSAQKCFNVTPDRHYRLLNATVDEKKKKIVLSIIVIEAENLESKDANGLSDPYVQLGICETPLGAPPSPNPQPQLTPRTLSETSFLDSENSDGNKLRKHHSSFRLSFKKDRRRDDYLGPVAAKLIKTTTVKKATLSPKWNEKFKFDIEDLHNDVLHLDIWDNDDESCVFDAVTRLNDVRTVKGLGRFFKQVCQSARQGSTDDFLGCVNIAISEVAANPTGLERWFKLEARSNRSSVQGRIKLKLWLSSRNDHGMDDDTLIEISKLESLYTAYIAHEISVLEPAYSWTWNGEITGPSLIILQQFAIQAELTELQTAMTKFVAAVNFNNQHKPLDPKFLHRLLSDLDRSWNQVNNDPLRQEQEQWLAMAMNGFVEKSLGQLRRHRELFPALHQPSTSRLEFLLRCLGMMGAMKAFRQVCPFNRGVRFEIVNALRKGSLQFCQTQLKEANRHPNPIVHFSSSLVADLQIGLTYYHSIFDSTNGVQYFSIVYKIFDTFLSDEVTIRIESNQFPGYDLNHHQSGLEGREPVDTRAFEIYFALQEFGALKQHLSITPMPPEKPLGIQNFHLYFEPVFQRWIVVSKAKALQRIRTAVSLDSIVMGEKLVKHTSSSVDCASILYQMRTLWQLLDWPDFSTSIILENQLVDAAASCALHYRDLIFEALTISGFFEQQIESDDLCFSINNLEYVRQALSEFRRAEDQYVCQNENLLEHGLMQIEGTIERILIRLRIFMSANLQKAIFHLSWSPDNLPANQAIITLLEYLDSILSSLNNHLLTKNFHRALSIIWAHVLDEYSLQMDSVGEKPANFHTRLYESLQLLVDFFYAEGLGLAYSSIKNEVYSNLQLRLDYHKTDTEKLMDLFYMQRLKEQMSQSTGSTPYGILAVRAYFNHDSLCVEVMHAKEVIPLDPNGFSDPFVIIELLPRRVFSQCTEQQTNVIKKTLHPIFDESYEFSVTLEQCLQQEAMILFTVMDHDVITANDFAGEAVLGLNTIPGVSDPSINDFHGLKQIDLVLMWQKDKNPILQILESRVLDKQALDFVRKQKPRIAS